MSLTRDLVLLLFLSIKHSSVPSKKKKKKGKRKGTIIPLEGLSLSYR